MILVVDDEIDFVHTYERLLRRLGHCVATASTRAQALAIIGSRPLQLVIADLRLPDGDGLDVVRAARKMPTPVIVITGYASAASQRQAVEAGAAAYVRKPFGISCFTDLVLTHLAAAGEAPKGTS